MIFDVSYQFEYMPPMQDNTRRAHAFEPGSLRLVSAWAVEVPPWNCRCVWVILQRPLWQRVLRRMLPWLAFAGWFAVIVSLSGMYR